MNDPLLITLGLLMVATAVTLLASGPRTWLVAIAQGIGIQTVIGAVGSTVQVGWLMEGASEMPLEQRVVMAVEGIPFHAAGWSARAVFESATADHHTGAMSDLSSCLPIAVAQVAVVGLVLGWRKMQDEGMTDPLQLLIWGLLVVNMVCDVGYGWWGA